MHLLVENGTQEVEINLTPRQSQVLRLVAMGLTNKEIAEEMNLAEATIKLHVSKLMPRLNASNRTMAVIRAQQLRIIDIPDKERAEGVFLSLPDDFDLPRQIKSIN